MVLEANKSDNRNIFYDLKNRVIYGITLCVIGVSAIIAGGVFFNLSCLVLFCAISYELLYIHRSSEFLSLRIITVIISFVSLLFFTYIRSTDGVGTCLNLICISTGTDIGGYIFGRIFGGPKLCTAISPNKTWSGLLGSILFANLLCYACCKYFDIEIPFLMTQIIVCFAILGDILESKLKRLLKIKDFSSCIPGHGGFLDRFDSLIMVVVGYGICNLIFCLKKVVI